MLMHNSLINFIHLIKNSVMCLINSIDWYYCNEPFKLIKTIIIICLSSDLSGNAIDSLPDGVFSPMSSLATL